MDLQEQTRMQDTYNKIEDIIEDIRQLDVYPPLVWVWTWCVARSMFLSYTQGEDPDYCTEMDLEEVWEAFWTQCDKNGFTLEYGVEDLDDHVRDWLMDIGAVALVEEDKYEDE